ncbi:hypothetical protein CHLNCDRAFT_142310 [Chlorella variabilis]|uniref:Uncharacterized protein n=1 Tax=Chlorella variabilis TaxID=554065 RepID=E1Z897_CHLVA|nr:hypothetical protein CHLNCDRAFT_142310 [Chlorella variabilis]EFN58307.1 hypothetical protein CHLNCDRAFT_142310 [Chlorella variabilis]|eukprot:XP_005850409.1 hypothetical protein CHLNCDRAFT_142310 [Chlorella variabilis]
MKGVTTSPQRGKPASAKRRARQTLVSSLLLVLGVCYVASYRWKAKKIDAELRNLDEEASVQDLEGEQRLGRGVAAACSQPPLVSSWALAGERASWRHAPKYSTHTCISQKFYDNYHQATCKFDNVCINASTRQFEYYVDPAYSGVVDWGIGNPVAFDQSGNPQEDFPPTMVNPGHARIDTSVSWAPVVKRRQFPRPGARVKWAASDQGLLHAFPPPLLWNFGHVMFDVMVPIFNMQHQFGLYDPAAQILIPFAVNGSDDDLRYWLPKLVNTRKPEKSVLRLTHDHEAAWVGEYAAAALGDSRDGLVCFKTLLAGTGNLNRQQADVDSLPYRQAVVHHLGIPDLPHKKPVITILNKKARRAARQHVQLMADTSILITPCGGLATVLTFLPPQSTAIVLNYWNTLLNRSLQMEDNYYQHMEYLDFQYMPVTPQDYEATTDRPECELVEGGGRLEDSHYGLLGSLVHCNLMFREAGLQRLLTYVDNAMQRWAARRGRFDVLAGPRKAGRQGQAGRRGGRGGTEEE